MADNHIILPFSNLNDSEVREIFSLPNLLGFDVYSKRKFNPSTESSQFDRNFHPDGNIELVRPFSCNYFNLNLSSSSLKQTIDSSLSIMFFNIRSFPKNCEEFTHEILPLKFDILGFSETWLNSGSQNYSHIENYKAYFQSRTGLVKKRGGGVALYVGNHLPSQKIDQLTFCLPSIESLFVSFSIKNDNFIIGNIYRPPNSNFEDFLQTSTIILEKLQEYYSAYTICIGGDFNLDLLNMSNPDSLEYFTLLSSHGFNELILHPTRVTSTSATLIDHIWCKEFKCDVNCGIVLSHISDHFPVFACFDMTKPPSKHPNLVNFEYRVRNETSYKLFEEKLNMINWDQMLEITDINRIYPLFESTLYSIYNDSFPIKSVRRRKVDMDKPYITNEIKDLIKLKHNLQRKYNKWPITYEKEFKRIRNQVNRMIDGAKNTYFESEVKINEKNPKGMWDAIRRMADWGDNSGCVSEIIVDGRLISDPNLISCEFNTYFSSVGRNLIENLPVESARPDTSVLSNMEHFPSNLNLEFQSISKEYLLSLVKTLKNTSNGLYSIPMDIYKKYATSLGDIITHICNVSLSMGRFPDSLKNSTVISIHKGGDPKTPGNYRPISLLPAFSKILEKVICSQLYNFFDSNNLFSRHQYGFLKKSSTEIAVLNLVDDVLRSFSEGKYVLALFVDLAKAFDSMDRNLLLLKLERYGLAPSAIQWFRSYFSNRKQRTLVNGSLSDLASIDHGVLQGSILGPVLFTIFINDLPCVSHFSKFILYADDTTIYHSSPDLESLFSNLNSELIAINEWFVRNRLTVNFDKTNYIIFHSSRRPVSHSAFELKFSNFDIERKSVIRFLGVFLDEHLNWRNHVDYLCKKLCKYPYLFYKTRHNLTLKALKLIYNTLIYPNLIYCITAWGSANGTNLRPLKLMQKKILRSMFGVSSMHSSGPLFLNSNIFAIHSLHKYMCLVYIYKSLYNLNISNWFSISNNSFHNLRNNDNMILNVPFTRYDQYCGSIRISGANLWNFIPRDLKILDNFDDFKIECKFYIRTILDV